MDEPEALGINPEKLDPVAEPKPESCRKNRDDRHGGLDYTCLRWAKRPTTPSLLTPLRGCPHRAQACQCDRDRLGNDVLPTLDQASSMFLVRVPVDSRRHADPDLHFGALVTVQNINTHSNLLSIHALAYHGLARSGTLFLNSLPQATADHPKSNQISAKELRLGLAMKGAVGVNYVGLPDSVEDQTRVVPRQRRPVLPSVALRYVRGRRPARRLAGSGVRRAGGVWVGTLGDRGDA